MYQREMHKEIVAAAKGYPVVTVTGPRQAGKTTLVRRAFPDMPYANLEALNTREFAESDPVGFLDRYPDGVIIDEIQRCPHLLSEIQARVDESQTPGRYILTGSHQVGLRGAIAQSLAGRTAILHLLPLSMKEMKSANLEVELNQILYRGCYPRIYRSELNPTKAYGNYVQTYLERDLRQMIEVKDLHLFQRFLKLCAGRVGQIFNKESLAGEVGVSGKTIGHWLSILEASYLVFMLPPYFENFGKRIIKSPKLYFCDVGLAAYLLGIESPEQMDRDPLRGNLVENLVVLELIKARWNQGLEHRLYFYRDSHHHEVDLVFQKGNSLIPVEIKSSKTFNRSFLKGINYIKNLLKERCLDPTIVYAGAEEQAVNGVALRHYSNAAAIIE